MMPSMRAWSDCSDAELIVEDSLASEPEYRFKQAIVQEIAYNNVLERERRELHGQVAAALEEISAERTDEQLEMLAYHYNRSTNRRKAIEYLLLSGEHARRLFANSTALVAVRGGAGETARPHAARTGRRADVAAADPRGARATSIWSRPISRGRRSATRPGWRRSARR